MPPALQTLTDKLYQIRHLWAVISFALGLSSYFLVERQPWLAAVLTGFLVLSWLLLLTEGIWQRRRIWRNHRASGGPRAKRRDQPRC